MSYIFSTFGYQKEEFNQVIQKMPKMVYDYSNTTYGYAVQEGGEKATAILLFKNIVKTFFQFPNATDLQISDFQETQIEKITQLRKLIFDPKEKESDNKIRKLFFNEVELSQTEFSELMKWYETFKLKFYEK